MQSLNSAATCLRSGAIVKKGTWWSTTKKSHAGPYLRLLLNMSRRHTKKDYYYTGPIPRQVAFIAEVDAINFFHRQILVCAYDDSLTIIEQSWALVSDTTTVDLSHVKWLANTLHVDNFQFLLINILTITMKAFKEKTSDVCPWSFLCFTYEYGQAVPVSYFICKDILQIIINHHEPVIKLMSEHMPIECFFQQFLY
jgi:hypothetical protein